jgi:hypothetical protein
MAYVLPSCKIIKFGGGNFMARGCNNCLIPKGLQVALIQRFV